MMWEVIYAPENLWKQVNWIYVYNYILDKAEITTLHNMKDVCEGWQSSLRFILIGYENSVSAYLQK